MRIHAALSLPNNASVFLTMLLALPMTSLAENGSGFRGELGADVQAFAHDGAQGQENAAASLRLRPEWWYEHGNNQLALTLFARADSVDDKRTHADIREAFWLHRIGERVELRAGVRQVFWGVTEGTHLVDIVNQTDSVDAVDGEQKLGQPMLNVALEKDAHSVDFYALIGARERTFPGGDGRLRLPLLIDGGRSSFESTHGRDRIDGAMRYQYNDHGLHLGFSLFGGNAREPQLHPLIDPAQLVYAGAIPVGFAPGYVPVLAPLYPAIVQAGVDAQYTTGDWLWKLEAIERIGQLDPFSAVDIGFEYTQVGALNTGNGTTIDIGWLAEYLHDSRATTATTPFEHDLLLGARFAFNDPASSELLASVIVDRQTHEQLWSLKGSRRFGDALKLALEARAFTRTPPPQSATAFIFSPDAMHKLRPLAFDDFIRLELTWYF